MRIEKLLSMLLIASMLIGIATTMPFVFATGTQGEVKLQNQAGTSSDFIYDTNNATINMTFVARVWFYPNTTVNATQNVKGWQAQVNWNVSILDCLTVTLPAGQIFEGHDQSSPAAVIDHIAGTATKMNILVSDTVNVSTPQFLCDLTFKIIAVPTKAVPKLNCSLPFGDVGATTYVIDAYGSQLDITYIGAYYQFTWAAPTYYPWLEVKPPTVTATSVGQILDVPIWMMNCSGPWEQIGVQFDLWYNSTLISYVGSATSPTYTPGTLMEAFLGDSVQIFYIVRADFEGEVPIPPGAPVGTNYFKVMILRMPNGSAKWNPPFVDGSGLLITLKIKSLIQALAPTELSCALQIANVTFIDKDGNPLGQGNHVSGTYKIKGLVMGRSIDIFTQWPYGFNGMGLGEHSDMFWPQKEMIVYANVTYSGWPEQFKDVAFQFIDPQGNTWAVMYGRTNETGIANVTIRLPWPCNEWPNVLGKWTVVGTVDVACNIVNDTMEFKYDYLVNIIDVSIAPPEDPEVGFKHCEWINATITFQSYLEQQWWETMYINQTYPPWHLGNGTDAIIITMTGLDETGVPFDFAYVLKNDFGGLDRELFCTYKNYTVPIQIHVVKFARAGEATLVFGALSNFPVAGGDALGLSYEEIVTIAPAWRPGYGP